MANVIIVDGPEAAGKSTLIDRLWTTDARRDWGPVPSIDVYEEALTQDFLNRECPLIVWDRSWASEVVYNQLLERGRDEQHIEEVKQFLEEYACLKLMVLSSSTTLAKRRAERIARGGKPDLPVDPVAERNAFASYAAQHNWAVIIGE